MQCEFEKTWWKKKHEFTFRIGIEKPEQRDLSLNLDLHWSYLTIAFCLWAFYFHISWQDYNGFGVPEDD